MKKLLIISLLANVALLVFVIKTKRDFSNHVNRSAEDSKRAFAAKTEIQSHLPIDTSDIVFLGNSLTEAFPIHEYFRVKNRGIGYSFSKDILERTPLIASAKPKKVFLMVGINDITHSLPIEGLKANFEKIAAQFTKGLYVQSVLPTTNIEFNKVIESYNEYLKSYCLKKNIPYIDLYPHFLQGQSINPAYTFDGIHLTHKAYNQWLKAVSPYINN